ncbi:MAG: hypothetical protein R3F14_05855 [Polyangiaceae bacterium]
MGVNSLPRALGPWEKELGLFPEELAVALAPVVERLSLLLGPQGQRAGESGEPDGYDGVSRRGPYERLLGSEWLLLSEIPEEFLRRAVSGEHSFLRTAHRPAVGGKSLVVLLDAGPDQLGAPRLAHLAALVVLGARAARTGATLLFAAIQEDADRLREGLSRGAMRAVCSVRSRLPPSGGSRAVARGQAGCGGFGAVGRGGRGAGGGA